MHEIKIIREFPERFDKQLSQRGVSPSSESILKLDLKRRKKIQMIESRKAALNNISKKFGKKKSLGESMDLLKFKEEIQAHKV